MLKSWRQAAMLVAWRQGGHVEVMTSRHWAMLKSWRQAAILKPWRHGTGPRWNNDDVKAVMFVLDRRKSQQRQNDQFFSYIFLQAFHSIAKCVAALAMSCPSEGQSVVNLFVRDIQVMLHSLDFSPGLTVDSQCFTLFFVALMWSNIGQQSAKVADPVRLFSLLSLGEIGRHTYVSLKGFILFIFIISGE